MKNLKASIIVRNIKLYLLSDIPLESPYMEIYEDLKKYLNSLSKFSLNGSVRDGRLFYGKSNIDIYFSYNSYSQRIFINEENTLKFFTNKYNIDENECANMFGHILKNSFEITEGDIGFYGMDIYTGYHLMDSDINFL